MQKSAYCGSRQCNKLDWESRNPGKLMKSENQCYKRIPKQVSKDTAYCPDCQAILYWKLIKPKKPKYFSS